MLRVVPHGHYALDVAADLLDVRLATIVRDVALVIQIGVLVLRREPDTATMSLYVEVLNDADLVGFDGATEVAKMVQTKVSRKSIFAICPSGYRCWQTDLSRCPHDRDLFADGSQRGKCAAS